MTDNITLPRAVGEQVREALVVAWQSTPVWQIAEARNALDAALAEPDAALEAQEDEALLNEPIAMRYDGDGYGYLYIDSGSGSDWQRRHKDAEPLYLAPPKPDAKREPVHPGYVIGSHWLETAYSRIAAGEAEADVLAEVLGERGWAKREPATDEQVLDEYNTSAAGIWSNYRNGWRDAERFHGIRKEDK